VPGAAANTQPVAQTSDPAYTPAKDEPAFTVTQAGFQIGVNLSQVYTGNATIGANGSTGSDGHTGLIVGGQVEMSLLGNFLFLQPEFRLTQQGFALTGVSGSNITANYLEIPVLLKVKFETTPGMHLFGMVGPNFGIDVGTSYDSYYGNLGSQTAPINSFNFAFDFAGGIEYDVTPSVNFFGELRYSLGLSNVNGLQSTNGITEQWRSFQLLTGLNFAL
jgi:opacity protein-like surface antigen